MGIMNTMMPIEISEFAKMVNEKNAHSFLFFKKKSKFISCYLRCQE